jgi:hypothetical protein
MCECVSIVRELYSFELIACAGEGAASLRRISASAAATRCTAGRFPESLHGRLLLLGGRHADVVKHAPPRVEDEV